VLIRPVEDSEFERAGKLIVEAYEALPGGHMSDEYAGLLAAVKERARDAEVLVAIDEDDGLVGCVTFVSQASSPWAELLEDEEAGIRMLAVRPFVQGRGIGARLVEACVEQSRELNKAAVMLHTTPWMTAAQRLYERLGFERFEERDWQPVPQVPLLAYRLVLETQN
jgi:ribosomal protein S18 acetylase RimI-like enzyme